MKLSQRTCRACKEAFHDSEIWELHHVRRFVRPNDLPTHLSSSDDLIPVSTNSLHLTSGLGDKNEKYQISTPQNSNEVDCIWYFVGPISAIQSQDLLSVFCQEIFLCKHKLEPEIRIIDVPLSPPNSKDEALSWSDKYWPTVYKRINPLGPHHSIVSYAEAEIGPHIEGWMALARLAAHESAMEKLGENFGCLVIERDHEGKEKLIALAADLRYGHKSLRSRGGQTNSIFGHAAIRAIGMIARKRKLSIHNRDGGGLQDLTKHIICSGNNQMSDIYGDIPAMPIEEKVYNSYFPSEDGYICTDFEIYLTHEPCIMCSMAILHSRFGRCVFGKQMSASGGLFAESIGAGDGMLQQRYDYPASRYGLFWRPELNWKFLCWQWNIEGGMTIETEVIQA